MSNTNSTFDKAPVEVKRLNGFDLSHLHFTTSKIGTLTPVYVDRLIPGSKVKLDSTFRVSLPPMAQDWLGKVSVNVRCFFVPERIIYGGWKEYMLYSGGLADQFKPAGFVRTYLPTVTIPASNVGANSLADYLGFKNPTGAPTSGVNVTLDSDPFIAYHIIWDDWYRSPNVQRSCFSYGAGSGVAQVRNSTYTSATSFANTFNLLADSVPVYNLRQVNYEKDYFTTAYTDQYGGSTPMSVAVAPFVLPANTGTTNVALNQTSASSQDGTGVWITGVGLASQIGQFSIPQLRNANQLQRFAETMCIAGGRYVDTILANYGVRPADALVDRSIYLGSLTASVYNNTVYQTNSSADATQGGSSATSPFSGQLASSGASSKAIGSGHLINFEAKEHGILMVLMDVQPHAVYSTGGRRYLMSNVEGDGFVDRFIVPSLSGIGHQPIYQGELTGAGWSSANVFGYTDRYAWAKWHADECHGLLRSGQSLEAFALQRPFAYNATPTISSSFLEVATTDMDNVTAVSSGLSTYGYWCDIYHDLKVVMPLPAYSIPTLENDHDTKTYMVSRGGFRF